MCPAQRTARTEPRAPVAGGDRVSWTNAATLLSGCGVLSGNLILKHATSVIRAFVRVFCRASGVEPRVAHALRPVAPPSPLVHPGTF